MDVHHYVGLAAGLVGLVASIIYILSILGYRIRYFKLLRLSDDQRTRPNRVTWFIWSVLGTILALSYYESGATYTLWVAIVLALECWAAAILSLWFGVKEWRASDIVCLAAALSTLSVWWISGLPELALFLTLLIDLFGAFPTLTKTFRNPKSEDATAWSLAAVAGVINLFAVDWSVATVAIVAYPVYMVVVNGGIALLALRQHRRFSTHG